VFSDIVDHLAGESGGNHDPDGSRGLELGGEIIEGGRARCPFGDEFGDRIGVDVVDDES